MKNIYKYFVGTLIATLIVAISASAATILTPSQGGTGTGTKPTNGQIMVGNASSTYTPSSSSTVRTTLGLGTLATINSPLPIANGGLATTTTPGNNSIIIGDGSGYVFSTLPDCTSSQTPHYTSSTRTWSCQTDASGGGGSGTITAATSSYVAYYTASTTLNGTSSLTFNVASGTLSITGPAGTSTLTLGTSTKPACQQARDSDDSGWTKSTWKGGILYVENTICQ